MKLSSFLFVLMFCSSYFSIAQPTTVGLLHNSKLAYEGYTLFTPIESTHTYLINNCGELVNQWEGSKPAAYTVYLLEDASLLRVSNGLLERFSWEGDLLWQADIGNDLNLRNHHDIEPLPNGNILVVAAEYFLITEAIAKGRNPANLDDKVSVDLIVELEPSGTNGANIVWEWHFWDHLIQDFDEQKTGYGEVAKHPELIDINRGVSMNDWIHVNGIDYHADLDQILLSSPYSNELYIIDHSTTSDEAASHTGGRSGKGGDFLWRWGNPQVYKSGTEKDRKLFGQHDPKWIKKAYPNEGSISIFNNNFSAQSSAIHIIPSPILIDGTYPLNENVFLPTDFSWTFSDTVLGEPFFNDIKSGMQVQANGNCLVGLANGLVFEITADKELAWAYQNPVVNNDLILEQFEEAEKAEIFRAERYALNYAAFSDKDLTPKGVIENENPLTEDCNLATHLLEVTNNEIQIVYKPISKSIHLVSEQNNLAVILINAQGHLQIDTKNKQINIAHLPKGLYYVLVHHPFYAVKKVIKI